MLHLDEDTIAQHVAGLPVGYDQAAAEAHLGSCPVCRSTADGYRVLIGALSVLAVPSAVVVRTQEQIRQRLRIRTFLQRLIEDPAWRTEVQRDPRAALERHRIQPTPQLLAALKEVSSLQEGVDASQLDERISKLLPPI
jgi:hypothetical protein